MAKGETNTQNLLRNYEGVIILHPDMTEEEQKGFFKKNRDIITGLGGGQIHHLDTWGKRRLGNPILKHTRGTYFHITFQAKGSAISELERTMRINDRVLRFQHTRLDDRVNLAKYVEAFKNALVEAMNREKEREARHQARRMAAAAERGGDRGDRGDRSGAPGGSFRRDRADAPPRASRP